MAPKVQTTSKEASKEGISQGQDVSKRESLGDNAQDDPAFQHSLHDNLVTYNLFHCDDDLIYCIVMVIVIIYYLYFTLLPLKLDAL